MTENLSRRSFLRGAALGAAAAGTLAGAGAALASEAADAPADEQWDAEYDVVVLGLGGAGANAAVSAYEEGATVLVCEKAAAGAAPCNTNASGQNVMATDDAEEFLTYLTQIMGAYDNYDEECLATFAEECTKNFDWLTNTLGADPDVVCPPEDPQYSGSTGMGVKEYLHFDDAWGLGREGWIFRWAEFPELDGSMHSLDLLSTGGQFDSGYYNACMAAVEARTDGERLTVWNSCAGKRLVTDAEGAVTGCVVEKDGQEVRIKANGGVCLCTGGFEANADMMSTFTQMPYVYLQAGTTNTGDGVHMGMSVGADLWHMSSAAGWLWGYQKPGLSTCKWIMGTPKGVYVGCNGARFMCEGTEARHGRINIGGRWIMTPMPLPTYYIVDSAQIGEKMVSIFSEGNVDELADGEIIQGETLAELSENIRAVGDAPEFNLNGELDAALERYNAHCHANDGAGESDEFGRTCTVPVETGPFYAVKIGPTMFNTMGGPRRNKKAQVVDTEGYPIEGLFSAGELGSIFPDMYNGGGNLGETMIFGRLAGRHAAWRAQGTFETETTPAMTRAQRLAAEEEAAASEGGDLTGEYVDGTYEGSGQGYGGAIVLSVTVEGGKVAKVDALENSETAGIGGAALPVYCEEVTGVENLNDIDVASGASNTLRGFKAAMEDALSQAQ